MKKYKILDDNNVDKLFSKALEGLIILSESFLEDLSYNFHPDRYDPDGIFFGGHFYGKKGKKYKDKHDNEIKRKTMSLFKKYEKVFQ